MPTPLGPEKAHQGRRGLPALIVLVVVLFLAGLAWIGAQWWGEAIDPEAGMQVEEAGKGRMIALLENCPPDFRRSLPAFFGGYHDTQRLRVDTQDGFVAERHQFAVDHADLVAATRTDAQQNLF